MGFDGAPADRWRDQTTAGIIDTATNLIDTGRLEAAAWLVAALTQKAPDDLETERLRAEILLHQSPRSETPPPTVSDHPRLRRARASWHLNRNEPEAALQEAAALVTADPGDHEAIRFLGTILSHLGRIDEAETCLREAIRLAPMNALHWDQLISIRFMAGKLTDASRAVHEALSLHPLSPALHNWLIFLHLAREDLEAALALCEACMADGVLNGSTIVLTGHVLAAMGRHDDAKRAYQQLKYFISDPGGQTAIDGILAFETSRSASHTDRVRRLFDEAAAGFDSHLIALGYRGPAVIRREMEALPPGLINGPALDLGCGTGLIALILGDLNLGPWTGIDLSPRMLAEARSKHLYADLHEGEILEVLRSDPRRWGVIFAADLICYFDAVEALIDEIASHLREDGHLVLSIEELPPDSPSPWVAGRMGRFKHRRNYIESVLTNRGFRVVRAVTETLRFEAGAPVAGIFVIAGRTPHAS